MSPSVGPCTVKGRHSCSCTVGVDDVLAYVDSIGEATGLVGWSGGAYLALAATAQSDAVDAVAPFDR